MLVTVRFMTWSIKAGIFDGVTLSTVTKAGSRKHLVADSSSRCGIGMFDADSMSFYIRSQLNYRPIAE